jgi:hypothetical protein
MMSPAISAEARDVVMKILCSVAAAIAGLAWNFAGGSVHVEAMPGPDKNGGALIVIIVVTWFCSFVQHHAHDFS